MARTTSAPSKLKVPTIFGMNFQAVSVGQKLIEKSNGMTGGYLDAAGTPSAALLSEIQFVDASIGAFVNELKKQGLYDSTLIVITAKHGQSPIDPSRYVSQLINGTSPATLLSNAGYIPYSESTNNPTGIGPTEDDVSLLWLTNSSETVSGRQDPRSECLRHRNRARADLLRPLAYAELQRPNR